MAYINSNLTNREAYALHGKLDDARMQELLDLEDQNETLEERLDDVEQGYYGAKEQLAYVLKTLEKYYPNKDTRPHAIAILIDDLENY